MRNLVAAGLLFDRALEVHLIAWRSNYEGTLDASKILVPLYAHQLVELRLLCSLLALVLDYGQMIARGPLVCLNESGGTVSLLLVDLLGSAHHELVLLSDTDVVKGLRVGVIPHRTVIHRGRSVWLHNDGAILLLLAISGLHHLVLRRLGRVVPRLREDTRGLRHLLGGVLEDLREVVVVWVAILGQHRLE